MITTVTAVGTALVAGTYATFSLMVLPALRRRPDGEAAQTMRAVNVVAERGPFVVVFAATTLAATALAVTAATRLSAAGAGWQLVGAGLSLGSTAVTVVANVPLNRRLEADGDTSWARYQQQWGRWNGVRAVLATAAVAVLVAAGR